MLETVVTIILVPFAFGAALFTGILIYGTIKSISDYYKKKK